MAELKTEVLQTSNNGNQNLMILGIIFGTLVLLMLAYISLRVTFNGGGGPKGGRGNMQQQFQRRMPMGATGQGKMQIQPDKPAPEAQTQSADDLNFDEESALN